MQNMGMILIAMKMRIKFMGIKLLGRNLMGKWSIVAMAMMACFSCHAGDFSVKDLQGKTRRLADYHGKWVLVNFWATWCPPCLHEIPELISLNNSHQGKDLQVIGVAMDSGTAAVVAAFVKKQGMTYPVALSNRDLQAQIGEVEGLPTSFLYNPQGEKVSYKLGEVTRESIEDYMKSNPQK
jgi:thiol-disulfide isomerase/thioredoxin